NGAIDMLHAHGSEGQKEQFLPRLVSGEWTATMNLTEPDAGSDVGNVRTRAVPQADGTYRITGTKIFITFGEHDLTDNIVHLGLGVEGRGIAQKAYQDAVQYAQERLQGRAPGAPGGTRSPIIEHPDVRRMLLTMKAYVEALRSLAFLTAAEIDRAQGHPDEAE